MPKRSSKDINVIAANIVAEIASDSADIPVKDPNAVALGRKGGLKGGKARAEKLSPEQRKEIAGKAARARWSKVKP
jgi:hypothetical protein